MLVRLFYYMNLASSESGAQPSSMDAHDEVHQHDTATSVAAN